MGDEVMTVKEKEKINFWDHMDDFLETYNAMDYKKWSWVMNSKCKYVELRVDMRDGGCIIKDGEGNRINPEDLAYQYQGESTDVKND